MLTLQPASLDWALAHALKHSDGDIFPVPFEYKAIAHDWPTIRAFLVGQNILEWAVRPHRTLLSPKARHAFRVITQLDPLDFLILAATVYEVGGDIESRRIPTANQVVFSYRHLPAADGQLFDLNVGYQQFQEATQAALAADPAITHVAVADIADFYPRIYLHRLENALQGAARSAPHVSAIGHLLSGWNGTETFGIPVGSAPARLLAEITISDVDDALLANSIRFFRFNDDYRIFTRSYADAYRAIAFLADVLFSNHGLTLQPQKTTVVPASDFGRRFLSTLEDRELESLQDRFTELLNALGIEDPYRDIDYADLEPAQQELIDSMNLAEVFRAEISGAHEPDPGLIKFILRRMGQLDDDSLVGDVFANVESLLPVFADCIRYLSSVSYSKSG